IQPNAEICVLQRWVERERSIERIFQPDRVARGGKFLSTKNAPLLEWPVRTCQIEPRFRALRFTACPAIGCANCGCRGRLETLVEPAIVLVELNFPPDDDFGESEAAFRRRRRTRARKVCACLIESRAQDP